MAQDFKFLLIIGGGKFGKKALDYAKKHKYTTFLIDIQPDCYCAQHADLLLDDIVELNIQDLIPGCSYFLNEDIEIIYNLISLLNPEYIIPVVPIHLMASLINSLLNEKSITLNPSNRLAESLILNGNQELILSHNATQGIVYLSHAKIDEICPDNCIGPLDYCPNFNRVKEITITQYLKDFYDSNEIIKIEKNTINNVTIIIESKQLQAGLGGLKGREVKITLKELKRHLSLLSNQKCNIIIATTCNCHGVVTFYKNWN